MNRLLETIRDLTEIHAPSGHETPVAEYIAARMHDTARSIDIDALGNLIVQVGNPDRPTVILDAHMDEVGLVVRRVDGAGNILFDKIGMVDDRVLLGREVDVLAPGGAIRGVIGIKGRHLQTADDLAKLPDVRQMWIDTGMSEAELAAAGVVPGVGIAYTTRFRTLANGFILGKALDCRIGCAVAMETVQQLVEAQAAVLNEINLAAIFTVQEEIGSKGAAVAAHGLDARLAIVLDTVPVDDPVVPAGARSLRLGAGPVLRMFDFHPQTFYGCYTHPVLRQLMIDAAVTAGIPHQIDIMMSTWLDSATLHRTGAGIPTGTVCFPRRYSHSPTEVAHIDDAANAVRLLTEIVGRAPGASFSRKLK
ncbi:MAG: M42 family metallopeptidase [Chloroflexota bacterium]